MSVYHSNGAPAHGAPLLYSSGAPHVWCAISVHIIYNPFPSSDGRWRPAIDHLKRSGTQGGVVGGVVAVLHPGEPIDPSARTITCDTMQIHGNHLVDDLGLAVRLRME